MLFISKLLTAIKPPRGLTLNIKLFIFLLTIFCPTSVLHAGHDSGFLEGPPLNVPPLKGAIFTTKADGVIVNENVRYEDKTEVYLIGGPPSPNAPNSAAALPDGDYYFQITDPSGKCLLSSTIDTANTKDGTCGNMNGNGPNKFKPQPLECRKFNVENGIVTMVYPAHNGDACEHLTDSNDDGGLTVQMFPFSDTPNPGGVYKAWVAPVDDVRRACKGTTSTNIEFLGDEWGENCEGVWGFKHSESKTDNFKVLENRLTAWPVSARAFHDINLNCKFDPLIDELIIDWGFALHEPYLSPFIQTRGIPSNFRTTNEPSGEDILTFDVIGRQGLIWAIDQQNSDYETFDFFGENDGSGGQQLVNMNSNSITTFSDLIPFVKYDGGLPNYYTQQGLPFIYFDLPLICPPGVEVNTSTTLRNSSNASIDTFVDGVVDNNEDDGTYAEANQDPDGYVSGFTPENWVEDPFKDGISYRKNEPMPDPLLTLSMGSVGMAEITVCKYFEADGQSGKSENEPYIGNWTINLSYPTVNNPINPGTIPIPKTISKDAANTECPDNVTPANTELYSQLAEKYGDIAELCDGIVSKKTESNPSEEDFGCTTFRLLLPNDLDNVPYDPDGDGDSDKYIITETNPTGWIIASPAEEEFGVDVRSVLTYSDDVNKKGPVISGVAYPSAGGTYPPNHKFEFGNTCKLPPADFGTKGFWHNINGLNTIANGNELVSVMMVDVDYGACDNPVGPDPEGTEIPEFVAFVNTLKPYYKGSDYFNGKVRNEINDVGCEPFDGAGEGTGDINGNGLVPSAYNNEEQFKVAEAGTVFAEISHFLVNRNNDGTGEMNGKEQLAQQLLAFLFNIHYQTGATLSCKTYMNGACSEIQGAPHIYYHGQTPADAVDANVLINMALSAWMTGVSVDSIKTVLDNWNNGWEENGIEKLIYIVPTYEQCMALVEE